MKKLLFVVVALFSSACGEGFPECQSDSDIIEGICVNKPVEMPNELIAFVIKTVQEYEGLDASDLRQQYKNMNVTLNFSTEELPSGADGMMMYNDSIINKKATIYIANYDDLFGRNCYYQAYVLMHEMLHLVWWIDSGDADDNHKYLGISWNDARSRNAEDWIIFSKYRSNIESICSANGLI